jgi:uncharacterized membrane protein YjgN (DUF898 family)
VLRAAARVEHCLENLQFSQFTHQKWCTIKSTQGGKMQSNSKKFTFDGGAATYLGTAILGVLITLFSLGICYPFALVLRQRWRAKHSYIDGKQLIFTGSAVGLFGHWIKWFVLILITFGIYLFWVGPRIQKWIWENTDFAVSNSQN